MRRESRVGRVYGQTVSSTNQDDDSIEDDPELPGKIFCLNDGGVNAG